MEYNTAALKGIVIIFIGLMFFLSCTDDGPLQSNSAPSISHIAGIPSSITPGAVIDMTCIASDPEGDPINYFWTTQSPGGTFDGNVNTNTVSWTAPNETGTYWINIEIDDGLESSSRTIYLIVSTAPSDFSISTNNLSFGTVFDEKIFRIINDGLADLDWSVGSSEDWINFSSNAGTISSEQSDTVRVIVDRTGLEAGYYTGTISVDISSYSTQNIAVSMTVSNSPSVEGYCYYLLTTMPISGITVSIDDIEYTTSEDGYYRLSGISAGGHTLNASGARIESYSRSISVPASGLSYNIETTGTINTMLNGTISSNHDSRPLQNATVTIMNPDSSMSGLYTTTDASGYYQLPSVPQGIRTVKISHDYHYTHSVELHLNNRDYNYNTAIEPNPPDVFITNPEELAQFFKGDLITFDGYAIDAIGNYVDNINLHWTANSRLGWTDLGIGSPLAQILPSDYSTINYEITLTATDAYGLTASETIELELIWDAEEKVFLAGHDGTDLEIDGNFLYMGKSGPPSASIRIIDISIPTNPRSVHIATLEDNAFGGLCLDYSSNLFVANGSSGMAKISGVPMSPSSPSYHFDNYVYDCAFDDVTGEVYGIFSDSTRQLMRLTSSSGIPSLGAGIDISNYDQLESQMGQLYCQSSSFTPSGIEIFTTTPSLIYSYPSFPHYSDFFGRQMYSYEGNILYTVDISLPATILGSIALDENIIDMAINGSIINVITQSYSGGPVYFYNVSVSPASAPEVLSKSQLFSSTTAPIGGIEVAGNYAYITANSGLYVFDISN